MFLFSWKLALIFTFAIPIFVILYAIFNKLNKKFLRVIMEDAANLEAHIVESLNSLATIKKFASEDYSNLKLEFRFINMLHDTWKSAQSSIISLNLTEFISASLTIILLWLGSVKVISQEITPGILMSFYALASYMLSPIGSLISSNQSIQDAVIAADRLFQILD
jgi:ATP-binding cassette subfamily B protein